MHRLANSRTVTIESQSVEHVCASAVASRSCRVLGVPLSADFFDLFTLAGHRKSLFLNAPSITLYYYYMRLSTRFISLNDTAISNSWRRTITEIWNDRNCNNLRETISMSHDFYVKRKLRKFLQPKIFV